MSALLLHSEGVFERAHLECGMCTAQHDAHKAAGQPGSTLKEERGCGAPPTILGGVWDPVAFVAEHGTDQAGRAPYMFANLGNVGRGTGWLWPMCPRYYLEFSDPEAVEKAVEVLEIQDWREYGSIGSYVEGVLSSGVVDLVSLAKRLRSQLKNDGDKRRAKEGGK